LQSKWLSLDPTKRSPDAPPGSKKRKDGPGKKDGKGKKPAKRLPPSELLARAFDAAPTLSELSVHSEAEEEGENEVGTEDLAANLVAQLMEDDRELEGLIGFGSEAQEGGKEAALGGTGPAGVSGAEEGAGLASEEKREGSQRTVGLSDTLPGPDFGQGLGTGPLKATAAQGADAAAEAAVPTGGGESVNVVEKAKQDVEGGPEVGGLQMDGGHSVAGASDGAAEGVNVSIAQDGGLPKPPGGLGQPQAGGLEGGAKPVENFEGLEHVLNADLLKPEEGLGEEHLEDAPNDRPGNLPLDLNMGLAEIQPGEEMGQALGFFPEEEMAEEAVPEENAVLAQKRAEMQLLEKKARVLESKKEAWLRCGVCFDRVVVLQIFYRNHGQGEGVQSSCP
jgi:hypothetical protein